MNWKSYARTAAQCTIAGKATLAILAVALWTAGCASSTAERDSGADGGEGTERLVLPDRPNTVSPELANLREVMRAIGQNYPPELRDQGVQGRTVVWFRISAEGDVLDVRVARTSGYARLDDAALRVARRARFHPARTEEEPVAVWVQIPISFLIR